MGTGGSPVLDAGSGIGQSAAEIRNNEYRQQLAEGFRPSAGSGPRKGIRLRILLFLVVLVAWHNGGMTRIRLSTTVDAELLEGARTVTGRTDSALVDEALAALLARHRSAEVDASYAVYDEHPLNEPDEWGDLASFRRAAAAS